jgi:hypothetical protein
LTTALALQVHVETAFRSQPAEGGRDRLTLAGSVHLPELRAGIQFQSVSGGGGGSGAGESQAVAVIVPHHKTVAVPVENVVVPVRKPSDVWVFTHAPDQDPPWIEHYGGLLGDGPLTFDVYLAAAVTLDVSFAPVRRPDGNGFEVSFAGAIRLDQPLRMRLQFRDPKGSTLTSESPGHEWVLLRAGCRIPIPPQPVSRLSGPDSLMTVRVFESPGRVVCVEPAIDGTDQVAS